MKELNLQIWRNDEAEDWSIVINGLRHEHVSTQTLEDLVEHAVIVTEKSLVGPTLVSSGSVPPPAVPQEVIQGQIEARIQELAQSNDDLAAALERLRESYSQVLAGKPVKNVDEVWAQSEAALRKATRAKNVR
jgi:hypothetical protein